MAAFIVVDIKNPQINTLVFNASIPIGGAFSARFDFFLQILKDSLKVSMIGDLHVVEFHL